MFHKDINKISENNLFREETCRVVILYVVAVIEAILLYLYKERGENMTRVEYKHVSDLPSEYQHKNKIGMPIAIAVKENVFLDDRELGIHKLVSFFKEKKLIKNKTAEDILSINDIRNTFHFFKSRHKNCDFKDVEFSLKLLIHTIENAPKAILKI